MKTKKVKTYYANIYVGLRVGSTEEINPIQKVNDICKAFCDKIGYCVTITPTNFCYKNGGEPGAIIGTINYPRFPSDEEEILGKALDLANILRKELKQYRVTVVTPDETIMLEDESILIEIEGEDDHCSCHLTQEELDEIKRIQAFVDSPEEKPTI